MATANAAGYDIYVRDNTNTNPYCDFLQEDLIINTAVPLTISSIATDPECYDGLGAIAATVVTGQGPFTYELVDLSPADGIDYGTILTNITATSNTFAGVGVGDYQITITDVNNCPVTTPVITIANATEITANITPLLPANCSSVILTDFGFEFTLISSPAGTVEYSADGGTTWQVSNELRGYASGTAVFPSIRVTLVSGTVCQKDFDRYIIPFPLDDLDITLSAVILGCNDLQVTVEGHEGDNTSGYEYTYTDNLASFVPGAAIWTPQIPLGTPHTFANINPTTPQLPGLPLLVPGRTYRFYVRDGAGCVRQSNVDVNEIPLINLPIEVTAAITPSCNGSANGEIVFTLNPTTAYPQMRWEVYRLGTATPILVSGGGVSAINVTYTNTITATSLSEDDYYIQITQVDASNTDACVGGSANIFLNELSALNASSSHIRDISCNLPGLIQVTGLTGGGGSPYTFDVSGPAAFTTLTGLTSNPIQIPVNSPAGDYTITVYDQYNCPLVLAPITMSLSPNPTITVSQNNCSSPIQLVVTGGSAAGNLRYAIVTNGAAAPTSFLDNGGIFNNVAPGSYDAYVIDGNGCTNMQSAFVVNPVLSADVSLTKLIDCTVTPDANITIEALVGSGSYNYSITNTAGVPAVNDVAFPSNPFVYQAPSAGVYTVTIHDNNTPNNVTCDREFTIIVLDAVTPAFTEVHADVTCNGSTDGTITITETLNGINPLTYTISPLVGNFNATTNTFEDLPVGNYTVTGTGTNNCSFIIAGINIGEPDAMVVVGPTVVEFACTSGNNSNFATISIDEAAIIGGSNNYVRYEFINDQGTPAIGDDVVVQNGANTTYTETNIIGGTYIINVYDDNGCSGSQTATILPFNELLPATLTVDLEITCANSGENVTINAFGSLTDSSTPVGLANYEFRQLPAGAFQAANQFTNLPIGNHNFEVRNVNTGCIVSISHTVEDPNTFEIATTTTDVVCFGTDGSVTFTISDTINPYAAGFTWQIYNSQGTAALGDDVAIAAATGVSATVGPTAPFAIGAGEYRVEITQDSDPSCVNNALFTIAGPSAAITANTDVTPITCVGNDGVIEIIDVLGGWGTYQYYVGTLAPTVAGDFVTTPRFDALAPGTYQAWVIDQNGCQQEIQNTIVLANPTPIAATLQVNQPNCTNFSGEIEVIGVTGGQGSNYTYQLIKDGTPIGAPQNTTTFSGLDAGSYTVQIDDQWTCTFSTLAEVLYEPIVPLATVVKTIDCTVDPGAQVTITQTGGSGNFTYTVVFPDTSTPLPSNTTGVFTTLTLVGDYVFTITDQAVGHACPVTITQNIQDRILPVLTIDAFTDVTCNTADDGTITVSTVDNGVGPYTFEIISGPGSSATFPIAPTSNTNTSAVFTALDGNAAGITYTIRATGANNCTTDIVQIITQPDAMVVINPNVVQFMCTTGNNSNFATISIDDTTIIGGSGTYVRYEFINDQGTVATGDDVVVQNGTNTTYTETNIVGGTYIINVYDDNGCLGTQTATIVAFDELLPATLAVDVEITCANSGENVTINAFGSLTDSSTPVGLANYEFRQLPAGAFQAANQFTNLPIGNHNFEVRNVNTGCIVSISHTVEDPNTFEIATTTTDVVCFGTDGSVTFTISDTINPYAAGFTWQIYNSQGTAALGDDVAIAAATGVSATVGPTAPFAIGAGEYRVEITQDSDPSCVNNALFTIAGPSAAITANTDVTPITCVGNDGVIEIIDVLGGWGTYQYYVGTLAPTVAGDFVTTPRFDALAPGTYQAWVIDQNGCQQEIQNTIVLANPTPIAATLQVNQPNCTNFSGEIEVIGVTGGQGSNYTYQLIKDGTPIGAPQNTTTFSGLDAGSYTVQIDDQWTCTFSTLAEVLYEPIVPLATVVKTIDCTVDPGAQVTITQTGGSGNFTYTVVFPDTSTPLPSNTTGVFTTLTLVGDYVFTITDQAVGHACPVTITQNIQDRILPVLTIDAFTDVTCNTADDGTITVSTVDNGVGPYTFEIISGPGSSATFPIAPTSNTNTSAVFTALDGNAAGITYTIRATGANNCTTDIVQIITQPDAMVVINPNVVQFMCTTGNNSNFATISIDDTTIIGGSGTYVRYEFINDQGTVATGDDVVVQNGTNTTYTETNIIGGTYIINVYDDNGCLGTTNAAILPFTTISDATVTTISEITCTPGNDGQIQVGITITPALATPNLEYTTIGTNVVYTQTNATGLFTGLGIGNYAISITNLDTGCIVQTTHEILDPDVIEVIATKLTDEECLNNSVDDGSFSIAINNYTGNYSYQVYDNNDIPVPGAGFSGAGNTTIPLIISNLTGGVYYVQIIETDAPFCEEDSNRITIIAPEFPVSATVSQQASPSCTNDQGSILVDPEGGVGPYTIVLTNTTTTQSYTETNVEAFIFSGLSGGSFDITITDAMGCPIVDTIILVTPDALIPTIASTPLVCFNANTATVTASVNVRNVTPNYLYQLNRYDATGTTIVTTSANQTSSTFVGLNAGFYSITVNDDVSCSEETTIVEIVNPTQVEAQLIRTSPLTCTTGVELLLTTTGGSGSYEYSVDDITWIAMTGSSQNLPVTGTLGAGTYRYYVRDAVNTCASVQSNEISEDAIDPLILILDTTTAYINCNGENTATIYTAATGGLGNYRYELFTDVSLSVASRIAGPQSLGEFTNLAAGTYYVNVFSEDCTAPAQQVIVTEPTPLDYTDSFTDALCFGEENGTITVTLSGGSGGYQYAISPNLNQFDSENTFEGLAPGDYTVIAQDQNGCFIELPYTITAPEALTTTVTATAEICVGDQDGTIDLTILGGTAPYSSRLSSESNFVQDRVSFSGLSAGAYILFIRDANGCETDTGIVVEAGANLNATIEPVYECTGDTPYNYINIILEDSTVLGDVLYALDSTDPADMQLNPDFRNSSPGMHYIAIAHSNGCIRTIDFEIENFEPLTLTLEQNSINQITALATGGKENYTFYFGDVANGTDNTYIIHKTDTYVVTVVDDNGCEVQANIFIEFIDIEIPNFFTPDGDGLNDVWLPQNQEAFPEILTIIFDRYGREVYRLTLNTPGWDGLYNKSDLPTGDYWYVIKLRGETDEREFVGHFTLYR